MHVSYEEEDACDLISRLDNPPPFLLTASSDTLAFSLGLPSLQPRYLNTVFKYGGFSTEGLVSREKPVSRLHQPRYLHRHTYIHTYTHVHAHRAHTCSRCTQSFIIVACWLLPTH